MPDNLKESFPFVSVIIPTYDDWDNLRICISSLLNQSYHAEKFEILVVNNNPESFPPFQIEKYNIKYFVEPQKGSYSARNTALENAKGEIYAFTDSDCIPAIDWLEIGVSEIKSGCDRIAGAIILFNSFENQENNFPSSFERCTAFLQNKNADNGWSVTANMFATKKCFDVTGYFDSSLISGGDRDWGLKANSFGLNIKFSCFVVVSHPIRSTWDSLFKKRKRVLKGRFTLHKKKGFFNLFIFMLRQLIPPFSAWVIIFKFNENQNTIVKLKACITAYVVKLYGTQIIIYLLINDLKIRLLSQ
jgi:glycosyltransferase involved in cell wall biosynthesis